MTIEEYREEIAAAQECAARYWEIEQANSALACEERLRELKCELLQRLREEVLVMVGDPEYRRELVHEILQLRRELA